MFNLGKGEVIIFSFFILLTLILTFPLVFNINSSIFADPEWTFDTLGFIHGLWWRKYASINDIDYRQNDMLSYPFGIKENETKLFKYSFVPLLLLTVWTNEIFAYNFYILISFILSGIFMYYLCFYLTKSSLASLVSSVIFSFCSNHTLQSFSHLGMAQIQWMPLYALSLLALYEKRTYLSAVLCGIAFSLVVLMNYYFGYFMTLFTAGMILFSACYILICRRFKLCDIKLKTLKLIILSVVVALALILPSAYGTIRNLIRPQKQDIITGATYVRPYADLYKYGATTYDYLLPSEYHPVFGELTKRIVMKITGGQRHWAEKTLYLGITPLFLALIGVTGWRRRKRLKLTDERENFYIPLFLFLSCLTFYSSLPPTIGFWKIKTPAPSFFLYRIAPMFRVYSRMGFVVTLCVGVLAGFGIRNILSKIKRRREQIAVALTFSSLILFEYTIIPPFRNMDLSKTPAVYEWLSSQPQETVIAEYPWLSSIENQHQKYLFYQRTHQKKMVNGAPLESLGDAIRKEARHPHNEETASLLSYLGAKYAIVHKESYTAGEIEKVNKNAGFTFVVDFPEAVVYEVVADKPELVTIFWKDFAMWEKWDDRSVWRWAGSNATMCVANTTSGNMHTDFEFTILSFYRERTLQIFLNEDLIKSMKVPVVNEPSSARRVALKMELVPGENILRFFCPEGETRIDDILHNGDKREVSFAFSNFMISTR